MRVYMDGVFLLNVIVDLLLILGTNRLTGFPADIKRAIPGAVLGGIYACVCLVPGFLFLGNLLWRVVFFGIISVIAFGFGLGALRRGTIFFLLNMALGGIVSGIHAKDFPAVCFCAGMVCILCRIGFGGHFGRFHVPVELNWQGRRIKLFALYDSGNILTDPVTGEQVLVCGADVGAQLLNLPEEAFQDPVGLIAKGDIPGMRLIPYRSVGQPLGMMAVVRLQNVNIGGTVRNPLVAFAPHRIGTGETYRMLTGGMYS